MSPTASDRPPKTLRDHVHTLRRHTWLIAGATVVAAVVAVALSATQTSQYSATGSINFPDPLTNAGIVGIGGSNTPAANLAATGVAELTQPTTLARVKHQLNTQLSIKELRNAITSLTDPSSLIVTVTATSHRAAFAAELVNADLNQTRLVADAAAEAEFSRFTQNYRAQIKALSPSQRQDQLVTSTLYNNLSRAEALSKGNATAAQIESTAEIPTSPSSPKPVQDGIIGGFLGFILGLVIAAIREAFDRRLRTPLEIEDELGLPIIGHIREEVLGKVGSAQDGIAEFQESDFEAFRILRTNVDFLGAGRSLKTIAVTSALPEEGKTTVASSLAFASAAAGRSTLLVECDLRRPVVSERFGVPRSPGLTDFLLGRAQPAELLRPIVIDVRRDGSLIASVNGASLNGRAGGGSTSTDSASERRFDLALGSLTCITAGSQSGRPAELLASAQFRTFVEEVSAVYDMVIFDTAPLLPVADTLELLPNVDGLLLCLRGSRTTRDQAFAAKAKLDRLPGDRPMGVVLTGARDRHDYGGYYYPYASDSTATGVPDAEANIQPAPQDLHS